MNKLKQSLTETVIIIFQNTFVTLWVASNLDCSRASTSPPNDPRMAKRGSCCSLWTFEWVKSKVGAHIL